MKGGCYCGRVRYEAAGAPFNETNCHCSICRRTTGAPFVAWFSVARDRFRFASGQPTLFRSTPKDHTRTSSKLGWVKLADLLPEYPERRPNP